MKVPVQVKQSPSDRFILVKPFLEPVICFPKSVIGTVNPVFCQSSPLARLAGIEGMNQVNKVRDVVLVDIEEQVRIGTDHCYASD